MTNVLVVMADDLRFDHLPAMPIVSERIGGRGRAFTQARCNIPLCQPARIGFLHGQLSRDHDNVEIGFSGAPSLPIHDQVAAWMAASGYRCGMFGKYVNGLDGYGGVNAPQGWSTWRELLGSRHAEDFDVHVEDDVRTVTGIHQSDYLVAEASAFIRSAREPWFAYVAPIDGHEPFWAHPDFVHAYPDARCREVRVPDGPGTPAHVRELPELTAADWAVVQRDFRTRFRELATVDRCVGSLLDVVDEVGQTDRTIVLFTSDNGVFQGEHRRMGAGTKGGPYDVTLRVPVLAAGPGFEPGPDVDVPVYPHQDLTATLVAVAGATPTLPAQAGSSLLDLLADPSARARVLLHEITAGFPISGDVVTTGPGHPLGHWKLVRSPSLRVGASGTRSFELYDLAADPDELVDLSGDAAHRATRDQLEAALDDLLRSPAPAPTT